GLIEKGTDKVGSVMPKVVDPNGNVESFGISVLPNGKAIPNIKPTQAAETVNAAAVLFSRTALEKVGLFDERFGSYLEDVDLGLRMSKAGFKHVVVPEVTVVHHKHQTSKSIPVRKAWYDFKNW